MVGVEVVPEVHRPTAVQVQIGMLVLRAVQVAWPAVAQAVRSVALVAMARPGTQRMVRVAAAAAAICPARRAAAMAVFTVAVAAVLLVAAVVVWVAPGGKASSSSLTRLCLRRSVLAAARSI